jgi:glycosyltransferase involved in cell wall biosynthesis
MKVLVVLTQPPLPEGGANSRCAVGLLRGLLAHGVDVRAIAARQWFAPPGEPPDDLPVEVFDVPSEPPGWRARFLRVRQPRGELARGEFGLRVRERATDADIVHLEETETAWCDVAVSTPSLVHIHYLVRRDRSLRRAWTREFRDTVELDLAERAAMRRHRHLVASSPLVAAELRRRAAHAEVVHAPLSLDPRYYDQAPLDQPVAGLIGQGRWPPTRAAMLRLLTRVWPLVLREHSGARLLVAGRGLEFLRTRELGPGVELIGEVPSGADFIRSLAILLFPLPRGSGMKVKTLEAIAAGVPVVTTPAGAEGIDAGEGIIVAEDDETLAGAAARLLTDAAERRRRGAAARVSFLGRYSPEPATRPLVDLYERIARYGA